MTRSRLAVLATLLAIAGCALYNEVSIAPLNMNPLMIDHGADVQGMVRKADYLRAVEYASTVESRTKPSAPELGALGSAELSSGRYDDARKHLRAALQLQPFHTTAAQIEWSLSQAEYMCNNYESALEWPEAATNHGVNVKQWHLDDMTSPAHTRTY